MSDDLGTSSERAEVYGLLADEADGSEPTTFTSDEVYVAACLLHDALGRQIRNADVIRGPRCQDLTTVLLGSGWLRRLARLRRPTDRSAASFG
jgi:hypothetical protein